MPAATSAVASEQQTAESDEPRLRAPGAAGQDTAPATLANSPLEIQQLSQVLRFDITVGWILGHWSRVSTGLAELDLQGYRVGLVTGTSEGDLAGSLTYYFNAKQQLERITFSGNTGAVQPLITLLASRFHFVSETTDDPSQVVYRVRHGRKKIAGELRIKTATIVRRQDARARFAVSFTIDRPEE